MTFLIKPYVENACGILVNRFQVLLTTLNSPHFVPKQLKHYNNNNINNNDDDNDDGDDDNNNEHKQKSKCKTLC